VLATPAYQAQSAFGARHLLQVANAPALQPASPARLGKARVVPIPPRVTRDGDVIGRLSIPSIKLEAPIVQGTGAWALRDAVGHVVTSVLPSQSGTTVLAAHNNTFFHHLDQVRPGDVLLIRTASHLCQYRVYGIKRVFTGASLAEPAFSGVVLETCYPLDELTPTSWRYLVFAALVSASSDAAAPPIRPQ